LLASTHGEKFSCSQHFSQKTKQLTREPSTSKPKLDAILACGVRTFIDLTEAGELSPYKAHLATRAALLNIDVSTIEYHRFPIRDRSLPESVDYMYRVLAVLKDNEQRGRISAVHCRGGIGRTGVVVGCWLVESGLAKNGEDALNTIAGEWKTVEKCTRYPHSPETGPQFEYVKNFRSTAMKLRSKSWRPGMKTMVYNIFFALAAAVLRYLGGSWMIARTHQLTAS
jgi:hypothetical protein